MRIRALQYQQIPITSDVITRDDSPKYKAMSTCSSLWVVVVVRDDVEDRSLEDAVAKRRNRLSRKRNTKLFVLA